MDLVKHAGERFICSFPDCQASYNKAWKLDAHMCKHTGLKPFSCERKDCAKSFCTKYHLARHELSHSGEKPYKCTVEGCADNFSTNSNLQKHISRNHNQQKKQYVCDFEGCGIVFRKNKQLKAHQCEQHTFLPPYQCSFEGCQMRFIFPSKLKRHEKVHQGYPCKEEGCSFTGKTWTEFLKHKKELHRVLFQCDQCTKAFRDAWFLQQHQRVHSEERQVLKCPRKGCDRSFTTPFNLQNHITSFHEEQRLFACSHEGCGKTFAMKQSLQRHSIVHDPARKKLTKVRPMRSLASKLSGFKPKMSAVHKNTKDTLQSESIFTNLTEQTITGLTEPVELSPLFQDNAILSNTKV